MAGSRLCKFLLGAVALIAASSLTTVESRVGPGRSRNPAGNGRGRFRRKSSSRSVCSSTPTPFRERLKIWDGNRCRARRQFDRKLETPGKCCSPRSCPVPFGCQVSSSALANISSLSTKPCKRSVKRKTSSDSAFEDRDVLDQCVDGTLRSARERRTAGIDGPGWPQPSKPAGGPAWSGSIPAHAHTGLR